MTVSNSVREDRTASSSRATFELLVQFVERHKHHFWRWIVAGLCFASSCAHAQRSVTLAWDRNAETNIAGYRVHYGVVSRVYTNTVNAGNMTTASVTNLVAGATYRFAVTAYNTTGAESDFSSEISFTTTNTVVPNVPPTLNAIGNVTINEDSGPRSVSLTGIGSGGENQTLIVTASATPPSLIPAVQVNYTSPNATGTVSFVTAPNLSGTGTVSVAVSDGLAQVVRSFVVVVNPVNDQPTLSPIANRTIVEDTATPAIAFTIGDVETPASSLTLSGISSSLTLVPNANIVFGGSGSNRTVRVTPAANQSGTASIQVTVSDGTLSATRTFDVIVTASNDPPTIAAMPAATVPALTATLLQSVTIGDIDTAASSLVLTGTSSDTSVLPHANIVIGTSGLSRTLSVNPLRAGAATVTLTVSDGLAQSARSFSLTVTNAVTTNVPPTLAAIANVALNEDAGPRSVALAGIGSGGENQTLTVTASATPPSLIPSVQVNYASPNTTGVVSFVTATNAWGTGTVNVAVSDGVAQTVRSFLVTVNPVNDQPTLSPIANRTIVEDTATPAIAFTIGDVETPASSLTLSGISSNLTLVPSANIVFGGSGSNRTVQVTPAPNQFGTAAIQVLVSDGTLSATRIFQLTVTASNDPPTIAAMPAATVLALTATPLQPVLIGDIDTAASNLTVTGTSSDTNVLPNANILLGAIGLSRTLSVHPVRTGSTTVTLRVSDGLAESAQSFLLTATNSTSMVRMRPSFNPAVRGFTITWDTRVGAVYRILSKSLLTQTNWVNVTGDFTATSTTTSWTDLTAGREPSGFYIIQLMSPIP